MSQKFDTINALEPTH